MMSSILRSIVRSTAALVAIAAAARSEACDPNPDILAFDPSFDAVVHPCSSTETIASGLGWAEGPVWVDADDSQVYRGAGKGGIMFSDTINNVAHRYDIGSEVLLAQMKPSGCHGENCEDLLEPGSNGLLHMKEMGAAKDVLLFCAHGDRHVGALALTDAGFRRTALAATYDGKKLNSPNDLAVDPKTGDIYFTDPPYGLVEKEEDKAKELDFAGVYRMRRGYVEARLAGGPLKEPELLWKELKRPNGIGFSADGSVLYVANSDRSSYNHRRIFTFDVVHGTSGKALLQVTLKKRKETIAADEARKAIVDKLKAVAGDDAEAAEAAAKEMTGFNSNFDGFAVDHSTGNIYAGGPAGVHVYDSELKHLGCVLTKSKTANVALGPVDGAHHKLVIAADSKVLLLSPPAAEKQEL